jgi:hypothetical protein
MAVLMKFVQMTDKPIMELGGGFFSTPLLHWLCAEKRQKLVTYEDNHDFDGFLRSFVSRTHQIVYVDNWEQIDLRTNWGVAFIDHGPIKGMPSEPASRKASAVRLKDSVDYIILHDTNSQEYYDDEGFWSNFKYVYTWKWATPNTSVLSNFKEVSP